MSSWSIVTFANEMPEHMQAFVSWHLGAGAAQIDLFIDDPFWSSDMFDHLPQVKVTVCDGGFWRQHGFSEPPNRAQRQKTVATFGYRQAATEWVLHADIDEFVYAPDILEELAQTGGRAARIYPMERIFTNDTQSPYSNHFRAPTSERYPTWLDQIFEHPDQLDHGVRGHYVGKVFTRTGLDIQAIGAHNVVLPNGKQIPKSKGSVESPLLHFFVFDFEHFQRKGKWKFSRGPGNRLRDAAIEHPTERDRRRIHMAEVFESGNVTAQKALFNDLFVFPPERLSRLSEWQTVRQFEFTKTLERRLKQYFP